jgi:hypothetical protein
MVALFVTTGTEATAWVEKEREAWEQDAHAG